MFSVSSVSIGPSFRLTLPGTTSSAATLQQLKKNGWSFKELADFNQGRALYNLSRWNITKKESLPYPHFVAALTFARTEEEFDLLLLSPRYRRGVSATNRLLTEEDVREFELHNQQLNTGPLHNYFLEEQVAAMYLIAYGLIQGWPSSFLLKIAAWRRQASAEDSSWGTLRKLSPLHYKSYCREVYLPLGDFLLKTVPFNLFPTVKGPIFKGFNHPTIYLLRAHFQGRLYNLSRFYLFTYEGVSDPKDNCCYPEVQPGQQAAIVLHPTGKEALRAYYEVIIPLIEEARQSRTLDLTPHIFWWICAAKPWERGDPSIAEAMVRALYKSKGTDLPPWRPHVIPWVEATKCFSPEAFAEKWTSLFESV